MPTEPTEEEREWASMHWIGPTKHGAVHEPMTADERRFD